MKKKTTMFDREILKKALVESLKKLNPVIQSKNFVILIVYIGAIITTAIAVKGIYDKNISGFNIQIALWLWITVLFANFSEAIAEGHGKARADSLKKAKKETPAKLYVNGSIVEKNSSDLHIGDIVVCSAGDIIPGDGDIVEGIASIDESAITGESAPVLRESGGDRCSVTMGTKVLSDEIKIRIATEQGNTFIDRMISLIEKATRQKTPNEVALTILLIALSLIFIIVIFTLPVFVLYTSKFSGKNSGINITILISLLVCLIPTTIGGLLSAIGISGMVRLIEKNVIATSGRAIEAAGDVDVMLLDKTGTITYGNRMADNLYPVDGVSQDRLARAAFLSSSSDETPEGKSIITFIRNNYKRASDDYCDKKILFVPFSAVTKMSGVDYFDEQNKIIIRKGSVDAIKRHILELGGEFPQQARIISEKISREGGTPLLVSENDKVLGLIYLKDIVKSEIKERFKELKAMGIKTIMITGDNPLTAATIAAEAGVDDFVAEATPESKLAKIRNEQKNGHMVAMIGDGTNDAPALAQADVGVAMNSGTQTAKEAGNFIDLDNNPTKLIEVVETGKQLLMTRGALTTFSIANDIAKYFAILPAIFAGLYILNGTSIFEVFNIMHLKSPQTAILSAVIFNALIIIMLLPLALKGVKYNPKSTDRILTENILIYGVGGIISPFIGIKIIDMILSLFMS